MIDVALGRTPSIFLVDSVADRVLFVCVFACVFVCLFVLQVTHKKIDPRGDGEQNKIMSVAVRRARRGTAASFFSSLVSLSCSSADAALKRLLSPPVRRRRRAAPTPRWPPAGCAQSGQQL
jgi:hypothetical protein